ncbi:MAG: hypothetical protein ACO1RX_06105 [Candidatus Sericytochromatia bacterium]
MTQIRPNRTQPAVKRAATRQSKPSTPPAQPPQAPPVAPDNVRLLTPVRDPQLLHMKANLFQLVAAAETDFVRLDGNADGRLEKEEMLKAPLSSTALPETQYQQRMLQTKLAHYASAIDLNGNGIERPELSSLVSRLNAQDTPLAAMTRLPLSEPFMVSLDVNVGTLPTLAYTLTPGPMRNQTFEAVILRKNRQDERVSHETAVQEQRLQLGEQTITLVVPQLPPGENLPTSPQNIADALAMIPAPLRQYARRVEINPQPYRFEITPGELKAADMTAGGNGTITLYPLERKPEDTYRTLLHELGHVQSFQLWGYSAESAGWQNWFAAMEADGLSPSRYARENASERGYEDFAEATSAYFLSVGTPQYEEIKALFPHRFAILERINESEKGGIPTADGVKVDSPAPAHGAPLCACGAHGAP